MRTDKANVVYCYTILCHLAASAAVRFAERGCPIMEIEGGFEGWKEHDFDIEGEAVNRLKKTTSRLFALALRRARKHTS